MTLVVIAAGGTAGHVVPALAVAAALRDRGAEVEFVGGTRAEAELVPEAGYPLHNLTVSGFDRRNPLRAGRALGQAATSTARARSLLKRLGPDAVIGGGGYVSAPVGLAARSLGIPLAICEADSHLGAANRALAPLARRVFLAFAISGRDDERYLVTGRPVPAGTGEVDPATARARFEIGEGEQCVLVFGGSLGARSINQAALEAFGQSSPCAVLHICGWRDYVPLRQRVEDLGSLPHYRLLPYVGRFADALAAADLAVTRAGGSVFELAAAGLPSILIPYPRATAAHQAKNARWMAEAGAAVIVPDEGLTGARIAREVGTLLGSSGRLKAMGDAARKLARPDAADRIADETLALAG